VIRHVGNILAALSVAMSIGISIGNSTPALSDGIIEVNDSDWPPYFFAGAKDKPEGFGKELLKHCFEQTGTRAIFRHTAIKRTMRELDEGTLDVNVFSADPRRESMVMLGTATLFNSDYRPFVRAASDIKISRLADFDSLRLGNLAGLAHTPEFTRYLEARDKKGDLTTVNTPESTIRMLITGKIDTFVNTTPTVLWEARELGLEDKIRPLDYVVKSGAYHVAISRKSKRVRDPAAFLKSLDDCIRNSRTTSFYKALKSKYQIP
jgi:ABC-type amino acid transport substrate-binding protein